MTAHAKMSHLSVKTYSCFITYSNRAHTEQKYDTMIQLCQHYSRCFQRYDTLNSGNAEKIDCEKNSFEVDSLYLPKL